MTNDLSERIHALAEKSRKADRALDRHAGRLAAFVWPFETRYLALSVSALAAMDLLSTYVNMGILRNPNVVESGPVAAWALSAGGFGLLLAVDIASVGLVLGVALVVRRFYFRSGLYGYGHAAFVVVLLPYVVRTTAVVISNFALFFH
jgi:hypothetical protein